MFIWRGHGYWVLLVPFATLGAFAYVDTNWPGLLVHKQLWIAAALAGAGLICTLWGLLANPGPALQAIDRLTGLIVTVRVRHSLYGIAMQYWGGLYLLAAVAVCLWPSR